MAPLIARAERMQAAGDFQSAIELYEQALAKTPWNDRLRLTLAMTYADRAARSRDEGLLGASESDLRKATELAPDEARLRENLAVVLVERSALEPDPDQARAQREEAERLWPGVTTGAPVRDAVLERRLDLAYELLERGQYEAGIERLEALHAGAPAEPQVSRLLVQALLRHAQQMAERANYTGAAKRLDRAVEVLEESGCRGPEWTGCEPDTARTAHYNRVIAWINADQRLDAARALAEAERMGLLFPELRRRLGNGTGEAP